MHKQINIGINGMHCAACSARTEKALSQLPGVVTANVNLAMEEASITYDDRKLTLKDFRDTISKLGFEIREAALPDDDEQHRQMQLAWRKMAISWVLTFFVTVLMIPHMVLGGVIFGHVTDSWLMFALSLTAILIPARGVYVSAWKSVRSGGANMDVLIAMGTLASVLVAPLSLVVKGISPHSFAGIAAMIISFHLTGRYLEARARGKASEAIRKLLNLGAKTALILSDGQEVEIPIHKLKTGDILMVKPGGKIPTDGLVTKGESTVDESMATGESMPPLRKVGDRVLGGTINLDGYLEVQATKIGSETFLSQVIKLVSEAQHSKVPIQLLADRVTVIFVPVVLVLATLVFVSWLLFPGFMLGIATAISSVIPLRLPEEGLAAALMASIATLVIACPCALGLATPTALMVGSGIGAGQGILIRNGEALQRMKDLNALIFDKTGTLTLGKPELVKMDNLSGNREGNLAYAAALEAASEHPLAQAIVAAAQGLDLPYRQEFTSFPGKGVKGRVEDRNCLLGNRAFLIEQGIPTDYHADPALAHTSQIGLAVEGILLAWFYLADKLKDEAVSVVKALKDKGVKTYLISGDNEQNAMAIASQCGIEDILANVLPQDKAAKVKELQAQGLVVGMVGDGVNDAPALKQADIGFAMGLGTDIAIEAADITLLRGDLQLIPLAVKLSVSTFAKIRQNLFWAFFYNLIAIPLAAFGVLHPVIAEMAMAMSSVTVVSNANALKRSWKRS